MRWIIALLTAAAALTAASNEMTSLARFAGEKLNFPAGLAWTLPGMVTIATLAGALMWTVLKEQPLRSAGRRLNVTCAVISAGAVALDHASGAPAGWMIPAGAVGALVPALATWLTHLLARMTQPVSLETPLEPWQPRLVENLETDVQPAGDPSTTPGKDHLERVRAIVADGGGRSRVMDELGVKEHQAKQLLRAVRSTGDGLENAQA